MAELVHLRIDEKTRKAIKQVVKGQHFTSESEFIRDAVRKSLERYDIEQRLKMLQSVRQKVPLRKTSPRPTSDIFREFGIDAP